MKMLVVLLRDDWLNENGGEAYTYDLGPFSMIDIHDGAHIFGDEERVAYYEDGVGWQPEDVGPDYNPSAYYDRVSIIPA
jgi:hypothetical protein